MGNRTYRSLGLYAAGVGLLALLAGLAAGNSVVWQPAAVIASVGLAFGLGAVPALKGYQFTGWIIAAVTCAMIYPTAFLKWGDFDLRSKWLILLVVQTVMFGMGTQMSLKDFAGVARSPRGVLVGIVCHFSVMPLVGLALTKVFQFPNEIAAGVILIGSCSSGLASNVMAYLARANLALVGYRDGDHDHDRAGDDAAVDEIARGHVGGGEVRQHDAGDREDCDRAHRGGPVARLFEARSRARPASRARHRGGRRDVARAPAAGRLGSGQGKRD